MPLYLYEDSKNKVRVPIFFIHIPKCGGTTLEFFFNNLGFKSFLSPKDYRFVRQYLKVPPAHFDMSILEQFFQMDNIYSFAIIRCPYERMLSDFRWAKSKTNNTSYFEKMSFEEFCLDSINKYQKDETYLANHITPQHKFISSNVNKVFKLENGLELAIREVFADVGLVLNGNLSLPKMNQTSKDDMQISSKAKSLIYKFYEEDFKVFGYEK
tara:strand:- start:431 stop:1066 length:636 start_codon:yes stop_codon:yes gene_type:complete